MFGAERISKGIAMRATLKDASDAGASQVVRSHAGAWERAGEVSFRVSYGALFAGMLKGLLLTWLFASILFAHGCHGNEDNELFGTWMKWIVK